MGVGGWAEGIGLSGLRGAFSEGAVIHTIGARDESRQIMNGMTGEKTLVALVSSWNLRFSSNLSSIDTTADVSHILQQPNTHTEHLTPDPSHHETSQSLSFPLFLQS